MLLSRLLVIHGTGPDMPIGNDHDHHDHHAHDDLRMYHDDRRSNDHAATIRSQLRIVLRWGLFQSLADSLCLGR